MCSMGPDRLTPGSVHKRISLEQMATIIAIGKGSILNVAVMDDDIRCYFNFQIFDYKKTIMLTDWLIYFKLLIYFDVFLEKVVI